MDTTAAATGFDAATISAIAGCILSFITLLVTVISVICAYKAYQHQKDRSKKDAACELARYYSENIIERYSFVSAVFRAAGVPQAIKEILPYERMKDFTYKELCCILEEQGKTYEEVTRLFKNIDTKIIYAAKITMAKSVAERNSLAKEHIYIVEGEGDASSDRVEIAHGEILQSEVNSEVRTLLNDLEWFSMSCRYGLADEEMLYQSLQQTYISFVWLVYYYIASGNINSEDKLYTNVIWLFNTWKDRLLDFRSTAKDEARKVDEEYDDLRTRLDDLEKKRTSVEVPIYTGKVLK